MRTCCLPSSVFPASARYPEAARRLTLKKPAADTATPAEFEQQMRESAEQKLARLRK